jgi:hypothetical protein
MHHDVEWQGHNSIISFGPEAGMEFNNSTDFTLIAVNGCLPGTWHVQPLQILWGPDAGLHELHFIQAVDQQPRQLLSWSAPSS